MNPLLFAVLLVPTALGIIAGLLVYRTDHRRLLLLPPAVLLLSGLLIIVDIVALPPAYVALGVIVGALAAVAFGVAYGIVRRLSLLLIALTTLAWVTGAFTTFFVTASVLAFVTPFLAVALGVVALIIALPRREPYAAASGGGSSSQRLSVYAVLSLVFSLLIAPLGVVFGHIALSEIRKTGDRGRGLAIAGLVIGYIWTAGIILLFVIAGLHQ